MTVIVWDGKTLAADRMAASSGTIFTITKIGRVGRDLFGVAGDGVRIGEFREWLEGSCKPERYPKWGPVAGAEDFYVAILIAPGPVVYRFENSPVPIRVNDKVHAIGSGRDFALAAVALGYKARAAVELACKLSADCGCGVDVLDLDA